MSYISQISPDNGTTVYKVASGLYGLCATAAATAAKVVDCDDFNKLVAGVTIHVKFTYSNSVANPTLNVNGTGAKYIKRYGTTAPSTSAATSWNAGAVVSFTYDREYWQMNDWINNNDNTYDRTRFNVAIHAKSAIVAANIIVSDSSGYFHLKSGTAFDISYPILYAASAINAAATGTNNYIAIPFTVTTTQSLTLTAYKPVFIKGRLNGTTFLPISTAPLTQTTPTSVDGYAYILLGYAYSTTAIFLNYEHPIFEYKDGAFQLYSRDRRTLTMVSGGSSAKSHTIHPNETYMIDGAHNAAVNLTLSAGGSTFESTAYDWHAIVHVGGSNFTMTVTPPTGYTVIYDQEPSWTTGHIYELSFNDISSEEGIIKCLINDTEVS